MVDGGEGTRSGARHPPQEGGTLPGRSSQEVGAGSSEATPGTAGLATDERAELDRLRAEVSELRARAAAPRRWIRGRALAACLLIILGCLLAPLSVIGVWTANQVSDTSRYVANVEPLIREPSVQRALTDKISNKITAELDVRNLANVAANGLSSRGLPRLANLLHAFSGSIASAVNGFIHREVAKILASPRVARLWVQLNRTAHAQLVAALSGRGQALSVSNGQVTLDLAPFIDVAKKDLSARGLTAVDSLPQLHTSFALFSAKKLVRAQTAYRVLNDLKVVLPIATLVVLGLGVWVARHHRRALIGAALGFAASMLVLAAGLAVFRGVYLNSIPSTIPADAAAAAYDTLVRFIKSGLRTLLTVGLIVAIGAFLSGPSTTAVRTRGGVKAVLGWIRESGEHAGLRTGPVGQWAYAHRTGLRIAAVALAALIFVFWSRPTGLVALLIAIVLLVALGLIELIGRPPQPRPTN